MIEYRPLVPGDCEELARIIVETWEFDRISPDPRAARSFGLRYLFGCLLDHSFNCVAVADGRPAAIIVGTDTRRPRLHGGCVLRSIPHAVRVGMDRDFRAFQKDYGGYLRLCARMEEAAASAMEAELSLFITDKACRGLGAGRELYRRFLDDLRERGVKSFFVQTDTGCTYDFYEHRGLELLARETSALSYAGLKNVEVLLYGNQRL